MDLAEVKLMIVNVKITSVAQVKAVRRRRRLRLLTPKRKAATNAFQRPISPDCTSCARVCSSAISSSKRKKMINVTTRERPIIKNARITTMGLKASRKAGWTL